MRRLRSKIVAVTAVLILLTQAGTVTTVLVIANRDIVERGRQVLETGARIFTQTSQSRAAELGNTVTILGSDFGFKQAVASRDKATIASALANHAQRAGADFAILLDDAGQVLAASRPTGDDEMSQPKLVDPAVESGVARAVQIRDGAAYETFSVPVRAPVPIAWVSMGFRISSDYVRRVEDLTGLHATFYRGSNGTHTILASGLAESEHSALASATAAHGQGSVFTAKIAGRNHLALATQLIPGTDGVDVLLTESLDEVMAPYRLLLVAALVLALLPLLSGMVAAVLLSRAVARPVQQLAEAARRIRAGDYGQPVTVTTGDELTELAVTFNSMQEELASRESQINAEITTRRAAEQAAATAAEQAQAANRAKSEFLANMSHEIRTPLNGILGNAELLLNSEVTDQQRSRLNVISRSGEHLLGVINDILDFSKLGAGRMSLSAQPFDLHQTLTDLVALFAAQADHKGVRLELVIQPGVPGSLIGDQLRVRQVLTNLIGNAVKFTESGEIVISADPGHTEAGEIVVRFEIRDTGIGIPLPKQQAIFDHFTQVDGSSIRNFGGTGLGLSICRQLVALMHGEISVASVPGVGSTFSCTMRFGNAPQPAHAAQSPKFDSGSRDPRKFQGHVLVAEDDPVNQALATEMLRILGCSSQTVRDGAEALGQVRAGGVDLVLMDWQMPNVDGLTATREIRRWEASAGRLRTPIVALTANAMAGDDQRCLDAGMDGYLSKPFSLAQLRSLLDRFNRAKAA